MPREEPPPEMGRSLLTRTFKAFIESEKAGGFVLLGCTVLSLLLANSPWGEGWIELWHVEVAGRSIEHWINDGLMAVFFLLIGLELERELYVGELSDAKRALLPVLAAVGGVALPALIHLSLNVGTPTQAGMGIPMATDIAFALGVLALLGDRIPSSLKVFLVALAVIDDLVAIIVIAVFYATDISFGYLAGALGVFSVLGILNRVRVTAMPPYLVGGVAMWLLMASSGVHATITGVLLAFAVPFPAGGDGKESPSHRLELALHRPVAFLILPAFALANTAIVLDADSLAGLTTTNGVGIVAGLLLGKPLGIVLASVVAVRSGLCRLPGDIGWRHVAGAGMLGGIGFTMSIFITNLAFADNADLVTASKLSILLASLTAGVVGYTWLLLCRDGGEPEGSGES
ncbi:MAG: Na+/H+ antiporter NhaA [Gemmatimonadales bacterium]